MAKISDEQKKKNTANFNAWRQQNSVLSPNYIQIGAQQEEEPVTGLAAALQQAAQVAEAQKQAKAQQVIANAVQNYTPPKVSNADVAKHSGESIVNDLLSALKQTGQTMLQGSFEDTARYNAARTGNDMWLNQDTSKSDALADYWAQKRLETAKHAAEKQSVIDQKYNAQNFSPTQQFVGKGARVTGEILPALIPGAGIVYLAGLGYGSAANQAINDGATLEQATEYGAAEAAKEVIIEKTFGGLKGMKALINPVKVTDSIANPLLRTGADLALRSAGEGAEEVVSTYASPYLQRAIYNPDAENASKEELIESFLLGALGSGVINVGATGASKVADAVQSGQTNAVNRQNQRMDEALFGDTSKIQQKLKQNQQKFVQNQGVGSQNAQNGAGHAQGAGMTNTLPRPNNVAQNQSSQADFEQNVGQNIQNQNSHDIRPKLERPQPKITLTAEERTLENVKDKNVKALQQEDPSIKPYQQEIARRLLSDLKMGQKGGREVGIDPETRNVTVMNQIDRMQSEPVNRMLDDGIKYPQIEDGLNRIIEDEGSENTTNAKRVELYVHDALTKGYNSITEGRVSPNMEYQYRNMEVAELQAELERLSNSFSEELTDEQNQQIAQQINVIANRIEQIGSQATTSETETVAEDSSAVDSEPDYSDYDLNQLPKEVYDFYNTIGDRFGMKVRIVNKLPKNANGMMKDGYILLDGTKMTDAETIRRTTVHEFLHYLKGTGEYEQIQEYALRYLRSLSDDPDITDMDLVQYITEEYAQHDVELTQDEAFDELTAQFIEMAFEEPATIDQICLQEPSLAKKILDYIRQVIEGLKAKKGMSQIEKQQYDMLVKSRKLYESGLRRRQSQQTKPEDGTRYMFAGKLSRTADLEALARARQMEAEGADMEAIRQETGWFKSKVTDGEWAYEISDKGIKFSRNAPRFSADFEAQEIRKQMVKALTEEQDFEKYKQLQKQLNELPTDTTPRRDILMDWMSHPELYEAYPQLKNMPFKLDETINANGKFDGDTISVNSSLDKMYTKDGIPIHMEIDDTTKTMLHEVQHAVQEIEGFPRGSSPAYWERNKIPTKEALQKIADAEKKIADVEAKFRKEWPNDEINLNLVKRYDELDKIYFSGKPVNEDRLLAEMAQIEEAAEMSGFDDLLTEYLEAQAELSLAEKYPDYLMPFDAYQNTAGEIMARDTANRRNLNAEQRKHKQPAMGDENTVYADGGSSYSIQTDNYGDYVEVDTDQHIFDGIAENEYAATLKNYMVEHLTSENPYALSDGTGVRIGTRTAEKYPYGKSVRKNVANEKMKLGTELANVISVAVPIKKTLYEEQLKHHWADTWDYYGTRFKVGGRSFVGLLMIANTNTGEGRVLYDIKIKELQDADYAAYPSSGHGFTELFLRMIPENAVEVNPRITPYMKAVESGDMETAQRFVNERAKEKGYAEDDSYRMSHTAPNSTDGLSQNLTDMTELFGGEAVYGNRAAHLFGDDEYFDTNTMLSTIRRARNNPEMLVTIYRAIPKQIKGVHVRNGDWITLSKAYAENHGLREFDKGGYRIIEEQVPAKYVWNNGDSIYEFGYDDGKNYAYRNTKNNRKLLDPVTYDDDGNVIPLEKRFSRNNPDERYSVGNSRYQERRDAFKNIKHNREVSKVYSNTIKKSNLFTEAEKNIELNASEYEHDVKSEKESLHRAAERLKNDHAGTAKELMHKKMYTGEDLDAAMFLLQEGVQTARETGNYSHAKAWLKKIQESGLEGGRMIQAFYKYSRTTAEGIAVQAERYVQQAEDALKAGHAKGKIAGKEIGKDKDSRKWQKLDGEAKKAQKAVKEAEEKAQKSAEDKLSEMLASKAESMVKGSSKEQELTDKQIVKELYNVLVETGIPDNRKKGETDVYAYLRHAVENKERYTEVWESAKKLLKDKYSEDTELHTFMRDSLDKFFEAGIIPTYSQKTTTKAMKKSAQELGINLKEIIKENDGDKAKAMSQIVDRVVERTGLEQEDATLLAREVMTAYTKTLQEYTDQRLRQLFPELVQPQLEKASKKKTSWFDDIMELINLGAYENQDIVDIIKQKNNLPVLTNADIETIYSEVEKANQYKKYSYEWKSHMAKAQQVAADKMPQAMKSKATHLKRIMMMSNTRTHVRNLGGNMPMVGTEMISNAVAAPIDKKLSEKRGTQRTTSAKPEIGAFAQGFAKGFGETVNDIKQGVNTYRMGEETITQYEMPRGRTFDNAFLNGIDKAVSYGLMFGDRPFFEGHYNKRMAELDRLGYDVTSDEAKADAYAHAVDMVFQSDSKMSRGASGIREALNNLLTIGDMFALGDFIIPFVQTPANIADKLLDYTPVGLARAVSQIGRSNTEAFDQRLFSQRLGRSLTGMGILTVAYVLASAGIITGSSDDDPEKRRAMELSGWRPYSIKLGDTYHDYSWTGPVGMLLAIGADMYQEGQSVDDLTDLVAVAGAGIKGGVNCFFNMSFFESLTDFFGGYGDPASNMGSAVLDFPTQFAPALTNAVNKTIDPYQRETYDPNPIKQSINKVAAKLPLASQTLPKKLNVYGEEMMQNQGRNVIQRTAENMLYPSTVGQEKSHKVNDELLRLNEATGKESQFFAYPDKKQTFGSKTITLSSDEWLDFIERSNGYASRQVENLIASGFYKDMDDEDKIKTISTVKEYANYKAKKILAKERGISYNGSTEMIKLDGAVKAMNGNILAYIKMKTEVKEIEDNTGDGEKDAIKKYLKQLKDGGTLTDEQWWYMRYDLDGLNETERRACPYAYIKKLAE